MAQRGPPFDFDLNEPPPEDDGANDASLAPAPEPMREPSPRDLLPPPPEDTLPSPPQHDSSPPPEPAPAREPSAPVPESSLHDPVTAPVPAESSPHDPRPSPTPEPSPVLDLEAPLSSLDEDDDYDYDEVDLPPPPPPFGLAAAAAPALSSSSVDRPRALPASPNRHGERRTSRARASQEPIGDTAQLSSPETSTRRGPSRDASGTASSHGWRRRPHSYDPRDDAISKQHRVDYDEDAASSRSGGRRSGSPRRRERPELASPPPYEPDAARNAPARHGQPGASPRNQRRGRRPPQGFRRQERPQVHQGYHGPHGPEMPKVGYPSHYPLSGSFVRQIPEQEAHGNGGYQRRSREAPPFRVSSRRPHGREDSYHHVRQSQAQEPPEIGGYQHREAQPSSGAHHGRDGSSGGINNGGAYQQRKAPRGGAERFPDRPYHPYARDGGAFESASAGHQARREPQPHYENRRDGKQQGGPARGHHYLRD